MTKEDLDSDKLNYLIWRYLVESDYRETAVRLQKEWNVEDPQQLPFAPHVTNHALVSVLNKGLLYNAAERETARANRDVQGAHTGFFGPLPLTPATSPTVHHEEDGDENVRKRQIEDELPDIQAGSAPKRPRLSNGYENGFEDSSMDVDGDQNGDGHAYPSPEQVPSPIVVPTSEQAIQLDNPIDLSNETTYLDLAEDLSSRNIVLMQCEWNPRNPDVLAAAGTDALARMWTFSRATADSESDMQLDPISPQAQDLLQDSLSPTTIVTGISWANDGSALLIATEPAEDGCARLTICSASGQHGIGHEGFESPIIRPQWNLSNTHILVLSPNDEGRGALVTVIHAIEGTATRLELPRHNLNEGYDITWISDTDFVIVGGDTMQALRYLDGEISMFRKYETRPDHALCKVAFDAHSQLLATASETGMIDIWDSTGQCRSISAHQGLITSLAWQPLQNPLEEGAERLLASSGEDSAISIWNARSLESKPKCSMTMGQGVVGLAFTPDGSSIAGATAEFIDVWKIDNVRVPRATWTRGPELGWQSPRSNASSRDEDNHCLCWNSNGQKLAYGVNSMMAVINFPR